MRRKTLQSVIWAFIFSYAGFLSHAIAVFSAKGIVVIVIAFIYASPLLLEAMNDLSELKAIDKTQYIIDKITVIMGVIYLLIIMSLAVLYVKGRFPSMNLFFKGALGILPGVFLVKKFYEVKLRWVQNNNVAFVYFSEDDE